MKRRKSSTRSAALPFLGVGLAFVVLGIAQQNAFLYAGLAFLAAAAIRGWKERSNRR